MISMVKTNSILSKLKNHKCITGFVLVTILSILSFIIYYHVSSKFIKYITIEEKQKLFNLTESTRSLPLFIDGRFDNPWPTWKKFGLIDVLRWKLGWAPENEQQFNKHLALEFSRANLTVEKYESFKNSVFDIENIKSPVFETGSEIKITWLGHATMFIQFSNGLNFITDPVFTTKLSGIDFTHLRTSEVPCHISELSENGVEIHAVLISHDHQDHTELSTLSQMNKFYPNVTYIMPVGISKKTDLKDFISKINIIEFTWWQSTIFEFAGKKVKITAVPSQHWSIRHWYKGKNEALWNGYVIQVQDQTVYFAGDTGYFQGFQEIKNEFPKMDVALIPIGAYLPRWFTNHPHISPHEAIQVFKDLGARHGFGMHWLTFDQADDTDGMAAVEFEYFRQKEGFDKFLIAPIGATTSFS